MEQKDLDTLNSIIELVSGRDETYGGFENIAITTQDLKSIVRDAPRYPTLRETEAEAIDMILHKIARIVNGADNEAAILDSWRDIAGYASLVVSDFKE